LAIYLLCAKKFYGIISSIFENDIELNWGLRWLVRNHFHGAWMILFNYYYYYLVIGGSHPPRTPFRLTPAILFEVITWNTL
jgi:hypothetical protein